MGVEPFLIASTLTLVVAQRLARRICVSCRESATVDARVLDVIRLRPDCDVTIGVLRKEGVLGMADDPFDRLRVFRGKWCSQCGGTGFRGRIGVFEVLEMNEQVRPLIMERCEAGLIRAAAIKTGMKTMFQDGLAKVFLGETTLEEVFRVAL